MTRSDDEIPDDTAANPAFDKAKARRAARRRGRPGQQCRAKANTHEPVIDRARCEGKADCVAVCPYGVFEVRRMADEDFRALSFLGQLKSRVHGRLSAYTPRADACQACGLCVTACPEHAITLLSRVQSSE